MPDTTLNLSDLTLVAVFAHPDDEGFGCGGTLAMLAENGAKLTLVCVTNGDVGEISDPSLASLKPYLKSDNKNSTAPCESQEYPTLGF